MLRELAAGANFIYSHQDPISTGRFLGLVRYYSESMNLRAHCDELQTRLVPRQHP
jgi:hypothetical protein